MSGMGNQRARVGRIQPPRLVVAEGGGAESSTHLLHIRGTKELVVEACDRIERSVERGAFVVPTIPAKLYWTRSTYSTRNHKSL